MARKIRVVITGSRGLIGSEVIKYFKKIKDYEVVELDLILGHDLTDEKFVKQWFRRNEADYLINLFAIDDKIDKGRNRTTLFNISLESFRRFLEVNVTALFSVCREFARNKRARGIVNIASIYGVVAPIPSLYRDREKHIGYSSSKGAVIQLTRHLATHLAPRVRVNCIIAGGVEYKQSKDFIKEYSKRTPLGRMMKKDEFNKLLQYLCSDDSSYMTGSLITIDGGWTAW